MSSGSEPMEAAIKMARQYFLELNPPQPNEESYHGTTLGSLGIGGHATRRALYEPMLSPQVSHVSACNPFPGTEDGETEVD